MSRDQEIDGISKSKYVSNTQFGKQGRLQLAQKNKTGGSQGWTPNAVSKSHRLQEEGQCEQDASIVEDSMSQENALLMVNYAENATR